MAIYGTALLSICLLAGLALGKSLGILIGVNANVGGVGIAMLLLIVVCDHLHRTGRLQPPSEQGILFWSSIYIPVVVAMAASQNVIAALKGGPLALVAGVLVVVISFALVPLLSRLGNDADLKGADSGDHDGEGAAIMELSEALHGLFIKYSLVTAFAVVGITVWFSYFLSDRLTRGRLHGSAVAILIGLLLAYLGGIITGGKKGLADVEMLSGIGVLGGSMLRDLSIVATAFGVRMEEFRKTGASGILALLSGVVVSFLIGAGVAFAFGYRDPVSLTTIGGGAATYIVGPVTGSALGASSEVIALSVAIGLIKSILVMTMTPLVARFIGLDNPRSALIFGGLMGTTSGVAGGLAATDPKLVPYGAMTATFYTGLGCLLGPSIVYFAIRAVV